MTQEGAIMSHLRRVVRKIRLPDLAKKPKNKQKKPDKQQQTGHPVKF